MKRLLALALMGSLIVIPSVASAQDDPQYNLSAGFVGRKDTPMVAKACVYAQPAGGDYGRTDTDAPGGVTRACIPGITFLTPTGAPAADANGMMVQGNVAAGVTDVGNPVKVGAVYMATPPTLTSGQRTNLYTDTRGGLHTVLYGENNVAGVQAGAAADGSGSTVNGLFTTSRMQVWNGATFDRWPGSVLGGWVIQRGTSNLAANQVSVTTAATLIAAARTNRSKIIVSVGAANTCAFGNTGVTASTGFALAAAVGASLTLDTQAALYGVCSATTTVSYIEQY